LTPFHFHLGVYLPVFRTKKEAFEWLRTGKKTIDVRKGEPRNGEIAVYLSGRNILRMRITKRETGRIEQVVRPDNYRLVIPSATTVEEAVVYLRNLYEGYDGVFAAYHVSPLVC
jgi:ASC-1-like (ASCH) protein